MTGAAMGGCVRRVPMFLALALAAAVSLAQAQDPAPLTRPGPAVVDTTQTARDTAAADAERPSDLKVVRRNYRYRRQVGLALFMMLFVAVALTTTQTFNPE